MKHFVFFSILTLFYILSPVNLDAKVEDSVIIETTLLQEDVTVLQETGEYRIILKDEAIELQSKRSTLHQFDTNLLDITLLRNSDYLYVFGLQDQFLVATVFTLEGKLVKEVSLFDFPIYNRYQVILDQTIFVFASALTEEALMSQLEVNKAPQGKLEVLVAEYGLDLTRDTCFFFGGTGNEIFQAASIVDENLWVVYVKDQISPGDFGNAGIYSTHNLGIFSLNPEKEILESVVFQEQAEKVIDVFHLQDSYLIYDDTILCLEKGFTQLKRVEFQHNIQLVLLSPSDTMFVFFDNNSLQLINTDLQTKWERLDTVSVDLLTKTQNQVYYTDLQNRYILDVIYLEKEQDASCTVSFCLEYDLRTQYTAFFEAGELTSDLTFLRNNTHGNYTVSEYIVLESGYVFERQKQVTVLAERNIREQGTYPLGYKMLFSGRAWVNNKEIVQNEPLLQLGTNTIHIVGENIEETFEIYVHQNQIKFEEDIIHFWDYSIPYSSKKLYLETKNEELEGIYANETYYEIQTDTFGRNYIYFDALMEPGVFVFHITGYLVSQQEAHLFIEESSTLMIRMLKDAPKVDLHVRDEESMQIYIDIQDAFSTIRGLYIENDVSGNHKKMLVEDRTQLVWTCEETLAGWNSVYFILDLGDKKETYLPLFQFELLESTKTIRFGVLEILQKSNSFENLKLELTNTDKSNIARFSVGTKRIDISTGNTSKILWIGSAIFFGIGFSTFFLLSKTKKQQS